MYSIESLNLIQKLVDEKTMVQLFLKGDDGSYFEGVIIQLTSEMLVLTNSSSKNFISLSAISYIYSRKEGEK